METGEHLTRCIVYIDLNMVRNGVVKHPAEWAHRGYREIQNPPLRYGLINRSKLIECCEVGSEAELRGSHRDWVETAINSSGDRSRRPEWTECVAVGSEALVRGVLEALEWKGTSRQVKDAGDHYELRESEGAYNVHYGPGMDCLSPKNTYFWLWNDGKSRG